MPQDLKDIEEEGSDSESMFKKNARAHEGSFNSADISILMAFIRWIAEFEPDLHSLETRTIC